MVQITGLGHVGLYGHDLGRMRDFYARVLGLQGPPRGAPPPLG